MNVLTLNMLDVPTNWKGETVRARMLNKIAEYAPRTTAILDWVRPLMDAEERKLLILSDRREHLMAFESGFKARGIDSVGYYVGGMKQKDLDVSATKRVILGTYAMASEGMNIPTLNMVLLATPKTNIEQSVGRILRTKKGRSCDSTHDSGCIGHGICRMLWPMDKTTQVLQRVRVHYSVVWGT